MLVLMLSNKICTTLFIWFFVFFFFFSYFSAHLLPCCCRAKNPSRFVIELYFHCMKLLLNFVMHNNFTKITLSMEKKDKRKKRKKKRERERKSLKTKKRLFEFSFNLHEFFIFSCWKKQKLIHKINVYAANQQFSDNFRYDLSFPRLNHWDYCSGNHLITNVIMRSTDFIRKKYSPILCATMKCKK